MRRARQFFGSPSVRLAETYLLIIMVMSLGFSVVFYRTSSHELGRQIPPDSFFAASQNGDGMTGRPSPSVDRFLQQRVSEGRSSLFTKLLLLNLGALAVGGGLSYYLARRTLAPIEASMEAQSQFVSDASHELRTPLTAIQTSNEVALRRAKLSLPEARALITQNTEDIKRLKSLSDGLLNLARDSTIMVTAISLQDVVASALPQVVAQATEKDIAIDDTVADLRVMADHASLQQTVVILLDNAIKYSPRGSTVYLETDTKSKSVSLRVRDEGIGIRASDIPHLFRRFYRADNARTSSADNTGGYGLGLAIAQQLMHAQRGSITVESRLGQGSSFTIKLPSA